MPTSGAPGNVRRRGERCCVAAAARRRRSFVLVVRVSFDGAAQRRAARSKAGERCRVRHQPVPNPRDRPDPIGYRVASADW
jgi:hypothetical protein